MLSCVGTSLNAQINGNFEFDCTEDANNAFYHGCFEGWISSHGTPEVLMNITTDGEFISPEQGNWFMHGYVRYGDFFIQQDTGEGIAVNYDFEEGVTYQMSYSYRSNGAASSAFLGRTRISQWLLYSGLPNQNGQTGTPAEVTPALTEPLQIVHEPEDNVDAWKLYENIVFTPNQDFQQLWFRTEYEYDEVNNEYAEGDYFIDGLVVEILCDPFSNTPEYNFERENFLPANEFCYPENVFMDWSVNEGANQYRVEIFQRLIGDEEYASYTEIDWQEGLLANRINLSDEVAEQDLYFEPGYEYEVHLYVADGDCIQENPAIHSFSMECCEEFSADFFLSLNEDNTGLTLSVDGYYFSEDENITHEWIVLSSPNEDTGPYTLEASLTTSGNGEIIVFDELQSSFYYTVVHRLQTPCGEFCFGKQRFAQNGAPERTEDPTCEYCGPFICDILDELCFAPTGLSAQQLETGIMLNWDDHLTAESYFVTVKINDPTCCGGNNGVIEIGYTVAQSQLFIPYTLNCLSFQVAVVCNDEYIWSEPECFFYHRRGNTERTDGNRSNGIDELWKPDVYPNPFVGLINVRFDDPFNGVIHVRDLHGRVVAEQAVEDAINTTVDLSALTPGMYWLICTNGQETSTSVRVVKGVRR